jgi:type II secretory pathway component PulF
MTAVSFEYRAMDAHGRRQRGCVVASNDHEAFSKVAAMGLTPLALRAAHGPRAGRRGSRIRPRDLAHFTYQLSVLVGSRIPLSEGLRSIAEQETRAGLRELITDVSRRVESGEQVAQALAAHQDAFGEVYVETIRAAEKSGNLPKVLEHLTDTLERGQEMTRQVRGAMMYPACVLAVLGLAVFFLVGFVVPRFARMFEQRNTPLPGFTRALMQFGLSVQHYWWAYLLAAITTALALRWFWRRPSGAAAIESLLSRIPHLGAILRGLALARFSRILGLSLSSGLGLLDALELSGAASGQTTLRRDAERMSQSVRRGGRLTDSLPECRSMTSFARRMLTAGEQSGELPRMCAIIARHYERETSQLVKNLSTVIEPVLIVLIAGVVLVVALAIFLPMWDMVKLIG